jgi:hypothetical protein
MLPFVALSIDVTTCVHVTPHVPPMQISPDVQLVTPGWPQESHVATTVPLQVGAEPGVQLGPAGHEHAFHIPEDEHDCEPYVLHAWLEFGTHWSQAPA